MKKNFFLEFSTLSALRNSIFFFNLGVFQTGGLICYSFLRKRGGGNPNTQRHPLGEWLKRGQKNKFEGRRVAGFHSATFPFFSNKKLRRRRWVSFFFQQPCAVLGRAREKQFFFF